MESRLHIVASSDHGRRIWALWALGLKANQGVEAGRITGRLASHGKDSDEDSRRWAVDGLAVSGTDDAIGALLATIDDDPSPGGARTSSMQPGGAGNVVGTAENE